MLENSAEHINCVDALHIPLLLRDNPTFTAKLLIPYYPLSPRGIFRPMIIPDSISSLPGVDTGHTTSW